MRARIISDGTPAGTQVLDENGVDLIVTFGVRRIEWSLSADRSAEIVLYGDIAEIDAQAEVTSEHVPPLPKKT